MLVLLMTAVTGAWADETPLVTIESKDYTSFKSGSMTFDDKVTVTFSKSVYNNGDEDGWYIFDEGSLLTVAGTNGYTITSCKFYTEYGPANTGYTVKGESPSVYLNYGEVYTDNSESVYIGNQGIKKIEVYGTAPAASTYTVTLKEGTEDAANWQGKAGEGKYQALPLEGVFAGTAVSLKYGGALKVKSVKAKKKAGGLTYPIALSAVTSHYIGSVITSDGNVYPAKTAVPAGKTAVGILGKVTETGHGLILALENATSQKWNTINGWESVTSYAGTTLKLLPDDAARGSLPSYTTLGSTTVSNWCVAQKSDYAAIFTNLYSTTGDEDGYTYDAYVNAYITTGVGGTAISGWYWSATDHVTKTDTGWTFESDSWKWQWKNNTNILRPVLGF